MPEARIKNLPEDLDRAVRIHQARYSFKEKGDAITDVLRKFFSKEDFDYFAKTNQEMPINQDDPEYVKKLNNEKKRKKKKK